MRRYHLQVYSRCRSHSPFISKWFDTIKAADDYIERKQRPRIRQFESAYLYDEFIKTGQNIVKSYQAHELYNFRKRDPAYEEETKRLALELRLQWREYIKQIFNKEKVT